MSHELHDDAGAIGGKGCACAHEPKVIGLGWVGNTAFEVECLLSKNYKVRSTERAACFSRGDCAKAEGLPHLQQQIMYS